MFMILTMAVVSELRLVKIVALVCMFLVFESRIHKLKNREEIPGCSKDKEGCAM
ncbi:hypothetical protein T4A_3682 [Trichinella pseudospiralis]|uniref:Uncharacterized protein n=1 Tax=Trichinella pseudospiralis TaxID=6337 RepID=A0A0V1DP85_TRIPS|nr:hypothetical protein T4A_3682 [Trichinella pseudospiralis]